MQLSENYFKNLENLQEKKQEKLPIKANSYFSAFGFRILSPHADSGCGFRMRKKLRNFLIKHKFPQCLNNVSTSSACGEKKN